MTAPADAPTADGIPFTMAQYEALLTHLQDRDYRFVGYDDTPAPGDVLLRHDVDLSVERALAMGELEAELGVTSTYFLLVTAPVYNLLDPDTRRAVDRLLDLGHDVGLHFDAHYYWDDQPPTETLTTQVAAELESVARLVGAPVETVSFHVPPPWLLDVSFEQFTNAYAPEFFSAITYVSDSNQKWRSAHPFADGTPETIQILVHPGLWHDADREMDAILADLTDGTHASVDAYFSLLGP